MNRKTITGQRAALLAAALLLAGASLSCRRQGGEAPPAQAASTNQALPTQVSVTPARAQSVSDISEVTGTLNTINDVTVGVKMAGRLEAVYAREGDVVRAGQVVAQQDTRDLQAQLDQQRANLASARANLASAKSRLEQARVVYKNAQTTLTWTDEQTRSAVRSAEAGLAAAREQLAVVREGAREQEKRQAEENVAVAKADRDKARADLKRYQTLYRQQAISAQQLDQAQAVADAAEARYNSAVQARNLVFEGARPEDIRRTEASVEQARQQLVAAQSDRDQVNLRRADVQNALAGIEGAQAAVRQAEAAIRQAQASVRLAEEQIRDAAVRSPINGVVAERKAEPGQQLGAGGAVLRIVNLRSIYFDAQVSETQFAQIRVGQPVTVTVDALPRRAYRGKVIKVFPVASAEARSFTVRIALQNDDNSLRPNLFARGRIVLATHPNAVVVPRDAVLNNDGKTGRIFIIQNNVAQEKAVTLGFSAGSVVEILSGVQPGASVVTMGQAQLQDGARVEVVPSNGTTPKQASAR